MRGMKGDRIGRRPAWLAALAALGLMAFARPAAAQEQDLALRCDEGAASGEARALCRTVVQALEISQPRIGLAFAGGNPVPGTASTLGIRLGTLPRIAVGGRITGVWTEVPSIFEPDDDDVNFVVPTLNVDATVGLFSGFSPAPTIGGVGSVDLLASAGVASLPGDDGFEDDLPFSWGVGARVGILRESFTVPGISVSAMYRRMEDVAYGDPELATAPGFFETDLSVLSLRGAVSKRFFLFGLTAGVGYDHFSSDVSVAARSGASTIRLTAEDFENDNVLAFVNGSWTLLILTVAGEVGWQSGNDAIGGVPAERIDFDPEGGTFFGSVAVRVTI